MNLLVPGTVVATVAIVRVLATSMYTRKVTHSNGILAVDQLENVLTKKP